MAAKKKIDKTNGWSSINIDIPQDVSDKIDTVIKKRKPKKAEIIANLVCDRLGFENAFDIDVKL